MNKGNYLKLLNISAPVFVAQIIKIFGSIITLSALGHCNIKSMAIVGILENLFLLFERCITSILISYRSMLAKTFADGDFGNLQRGKILSSIIIITMMFCFFVIIIILCLKQKIFIFLNIDDIEFASKYIIYKIIILPILVICHICYVTFLHYKFVNIVMNMSIIYTILIFIFNLSFTFGIYIFPKLGSIGVAIGELVSASIWLLLWIFLYNNKIQDINLAICFKTISTIISDAKILIISFFLDYLGELYIMKILSDNLSLSHVAAGKVIFTLLLICFIILSTTLNGLMVHGGRSLGKKDFTNFLILFRCSRVIIIISSVLLAILVYTNLEHIIYIFTNFDEVMLYSTYSCIMICCVMVLIGLSQLYIVALRIIGEIKLTSFLNIAVLWGVKIPVILLFIKDIGIDIVGYSIILYYIAYYSLSKILFHKVYNRAITKTFL